MSNTEQVKWDRVYTGGSGSCATACRVLSAHSHLLPAGGTALELACGRGANALYLAARGFTTHAWDISPVAIKALSERARCNGLSLLAQQRDVSARPPTAQTFDVIVVSRFLDRAIAPAICAALRHNGMLFYQTFTREKVSDSGPNNPAYLLEANELLRLFRSLHLVYYHEEGTTGDLDQGFRNEAMLIARQRS